MNQKPSIIENEQVRGLAKELRKGTSSIVRHLRGFMGDHAIPLINGAALRPDTFMELVCVVRGCLELHEATGRLNEALHQDEAELG